MANISSSTGPFSAVMTIQFRHQSTQSSSCEKSALVSKVESEKNKSLGNLSGVFDLETSSLAGRVTSEGSMSFFQFFLSLKIMGHSFESSEYGSLFYEMVSKIKSRIFLKSDIIDFIQKVEKTSELDDKEKRKLLSAAFHSLLNEDLCKFFCRKSLVRSDCLTLFREEFERIMDNSILARAGKLVINGISCEPPFSKLTTMKPSHLAVIKELEISGTHSFPSTTILKIFSNLTDIHQMNHCSLKEFRAMYQSSKRIQHKNKITISINTTDMDFLDIDVKKFKLERINFIVNFFKDGEITFKKKF